MKHEKYNEKNNNELFFRNLASSYAEKSGNESKKELDNLNNLYNSADFFPLDTKVKSRINIHRTKKWTARLMPVAACFLILITTYIFVNFPFLNLINNSGKSDSADSPPDNAAMEMEPNAPSEILTFEFVSAKLPNDYTLRKIDYDYHKVIYYIINSEGVEIILSIEEYTGNIDTGGLETININDKTAYGISTEDYSFIQYKKDDFLYTLTGPDDYSDLIKISEKLI